MKSISLVLLLSTFTVQASPFMSVKERLRLHMWSYGLEDKPIKKKPTQVKVLPEEIERPLRKI